MGGRARSLPAASLASLARRIASIAGGLCLDFGSGLSGGPLGVFRLAGLRFRLQGDLLGGCGGGLRGGPSGSLLRFRRGLCRLSFSDTGVASRG